MTVKIRGKDWRITRRHRDCKGLDGCCFFEERVIYIAPYLSGQDLIDTIIHELCHAYYPKASEKSVSAFATDAARVVVSMTSTLSKKGSIS